MSKETSEIINDFINILTEVRKKKQEYLTYINEQQKIQLRFLEQEFKRLDNIPSSTKFNPRMKMLGEYIESSKQGLKAITTQIQISKIIVPRLKEGEILVHGRLTDENGYGIKNLVISLVVEGETLKVIGKSDDSGYYSIILPTAIVNQIKEQNQQVAITVYVHYLSILVHKSAEPIKLVGQKNKYEVIVDKNELNAIDQQSKDKKETTRTKKIDKISQK